MGGSTIAAGCLLCVDTRGGALSAARLAPVSCAGSRKRVSIRFCLARLLPFHNLQLWEISDFDQSAIHHDATGISITVLVQSRFNHAHRYDLFSWNRASHTTLITAAPAVGIDATSRVVFWSDLTLSQEGRLVAWNGPTRLVVVAAGEMVAQQDQTSTLCPSSSLRS